MGNIFRQFGFGKGATREQQLFGQQALGAIGNALAGPNPVAQFAIDTSKGELQQIAQQKQIADERRDFFRRFGNPSYNIFGPQASPLPGSSSSNMFNPTPSPYAESGGLFQGGIPTQPNGDFNPAYVRKDFVTTNPYEPQMLEPLTPPAPSPAGYFQNGMAQPSLTGRRFGFGNPPSGDAGSSNAIVRGLSPDQVTEVNRITSFERANLHDMLRAREGNQAAFERQKAEIAARNADREDLQAYDKEIAKIEGEYKVEEARIESRIKQLEAEDKLRKEEQRDYVGILDGYYKDRAKALSEGGDPQSVAQATIGQLELRKRLAQDPSTVAQLDAAIQQITLDNAESMTFDPATKQWVPAASVNVAAPATTDLPTAGGNRAATAPAVKQQSAVGDVLSRSLSYVGGGTFEPQDVARAKRLPQGPDYDPEVINDIAHSIARTDSKLYDTLNKRKVRKLDTLTPERQQLVTSYAEAARAKQITEERYADVYALISVEQGLEELRRLRFEANTKELKTIVNSMEKLEALQKQLRKRIPQPGAN